LLYAILGLVINAVTTFLDRANDHALVSIDLIGGPEAALAILGTVAASMVSLLATVLAITMVVVQLAMAQFSPADRSDLPAGPTEPERDRPVRRHIRAGDALHA